MYIQCITRKLYSNRFIEELIRLVDENKDFNESRTHFIESAITEKLQKSGVEFKKPYTEEELKQMEYELSDL